MIKFCTKTLKETKIFHEHLYKKKKPKCEMKIYVWNYLMWTSEN